MTRAKQENEQGRGMASIVVLRRWQRTPPWEGGEWVLRLPGGAAFWVEGSARTKALRPRALGDIWSWSNFKHFGLRKSPTHFGLPQGLFSYVKDDGVKLYLDILYIYVLGYTDLNIFKVQVFEISKSLYFFLCLKEVFRFHYIFSQVTFSSSGRKSLRVVLHIWLRFHADLKP